MKIGVFGGQGFIGKALQKEVEGTHSMGVFGLTQEDVRTPATFVARLKAEAPDAIVNLAALMGTLKESPPVQDLFETNVMGNLKVLYAARDAGIKNYIFTSSITVHGGNEVGKHQTRKSVFNPKHGYSASKAAAEYSMMQFLKEAPDMKIVTVRPTMVLGKGTYMPHAPSEFVKSILSGKDIEIYGEGLHEREWIWVDDVAEGLVKACEFAETAKPGYHPFFLSGNRISMRDLAEKVVAKLGGRVVFTPSTIQAFTLTSDGAESQAMLNWAPKHNMDTMLDKLIEILKAEKDA